MNSARIWTPDIARHWRYYVPPCRPSRFDLGVLSDIISELRRREARRPRMLILGSTTEFRDLAFEEMVESIVIDNSPSYHAAISEELTHPPRFEEVVFGDWREMRFEAEFDVVVGDLAVGQLGLFEIPLFLRRVRRALRPGGRFLTKSFFEDKPVTSGHLSDMFLRLSTKHPYADPFPLVAYEITVAAVRPQDRILDFADMFRMLESIHQQGAMADAHMARFVELGWSGPMKFEFTVPLREDWEKMLSDAFGNEEWRTRTSNVSGAHLPVYIARKVA